MNQPYEPTSPSVAAQAVETLKSLPSFEDTQTQVQAAINQITAAASQLIPTIAWETPQEGSGDQCERPYEKTDGKRFFLPNQVAANVDVSESNWAKIQTAAKDAAAKLEATEIQVMKDQPGNHDVGFYGPTGLFIKVGYRGNLVVSGYTGCRLPRDKK
ncbi:LppA family lipoprotein [Mycobacterium sp.]|uniref:LppA family lipoprotein n=1 Tax=Mycobacterium sp. TaxID=1785 RepID=UPI0025E95C85|nr:LppA family lipoprotein [Mycobacterium sp.]